jgi:hypothetical protein
MKPNRKEIELVHLIIKKQKKVERYLTLSFFPVFTFIMKSPLRMTPL